MSIEKLTKRLQGSIDFALDNEEDLDSASWNYQEGILITVNEAKLLLDIAKNKQTQEQKFYPCAVELLSDGTEHCTVECLDKKNCEFLRADATSR